MPGIKDRAVALCRAAPARHRQGPPRGSLDRRRPVARRLCPRLGLDAAADRDGRLAGRAASDHERSSPSRATSTIRKTIHDFAAIVQSLERLKLLLVLTVADIKAVGPGVWNGWKGQLLRTLYYETEPVLTGGHSQVSRDQRVAAAQGGTGRGARRLAGEGARRLSSSAHYPAYLAARRPAAQARPCGIASATPTRPGRTLATDDRTAAFEAITEITVLAPDHPRLLSIIAGACTAAGANIVDAQIFTTTDGRALDSIFDQPRVRRRGRRAAPRRPHRRPDRAGAVGHRALPEMLARARRSAGRASSAFALETCDPRSTIPGRTNSPSSRPRASTGPACSTTSPGRFPTSTSTSPRRTSSPSASAPSTSSMSPISPATRSPTPAVEAAIRRRLLAAFEAGGRRKPARSGQARRHERSHRRLSHAERLQPR